MSKNKQRNTRSRIVSAAWKLFYEQGYDETTVEDIVESSGTSKGSFYHYFDGKDALLSSLSLLFDEKYDDLTTEIPESSGCIETLAFLNRSLFSMIEDTVAVDLLARLLSSQLITHGEKHLLDRNRTYFKLLRQLILKGQKNGEIRDDLSVNDIVNAYAMYERALMYDYCLNEGGYSLTRYADIMMPLFLNGFKKIQS